MTADRKKLSSNFFMKSHTMTVKTLSEHAIIVIVRIVCVFFNKIVSSLKISGLSQI